MTQASNKTFKGKYKGDCGWRVTKKKLLSTDTGLTATITIEGKLSDLESLAGSSGSYRVKQNITVFGKTLNITQSELTNEPGGLGQLLVTATAGQTTGGGGGGGGSATPTYHFELDFTTVTRPLAEFKSEQCDFTAISDENWTMIWRWESLKGKTEYAGRYANFYAPTEAACKKEGGPVAALDDDWEQFTEEDFETELKYVQLVAKGVTEFFCQVPVIRKTSQDSLDTATPSKCGERDDSNVDGKFQGLANAWLKTADRWLRDSKHGSWQHYEEWSGFDHLDETLYPGGASGSGSNSGTSST